MRKILPLSVLAVLALGALLGVQPAFATVVRALDVEALTRKADFVLRGRALESTAEWSPDGKLIHTVTRVQVGTSLKGEAPASVIEVRTPGGSVGDISQRVSGMTAFRPDEEVILFLKRIPGTRVRFAIEGFSQGKFTVEPREGCEFVTRVLPGLNVVDADGQIHPAPVFKPLPREEFVRRVREALEQKVTP